MNTHQKNQLEALADTAAFLSNTPAIGVLAAMPPKVARLVAYLERCEAAKGVQALPIRGAVRERDRAAEAAIELALQIGPALLSYANTNNLPELAALAAVTRRQFHLRRLAERMQLAQQVLDAARPLLAELAGYGVTEPMLDELEARIADGNAVVLSPRRAAARRKGATRALARNLAAGFKLLSDEIDPLVATLSRSDPVTYSAYHDARTVFRRRSGRRGGEALPSSTGTETAAPAAAPENQAQPVAA